MKDEVGVENGVTYYYKTNVQSQAVVSYSNGTHPLHGPSANIKFIDGVTDRVSFVSPL